MSTARELRELASSVATNEPRRCALVVTADLLAGLSEGTSIVLLLPILARIGVRPDGSNRIAHLVEEALLRVHLTPSLTTLVLVYVAVVGLRSLFVQASSVLATQVRVRYVDELRLRCAAAVLHADWSFALANRRSDLVHALTTDVLRVANAVDILRQMVTQLALLAVTLAVALRLAPDLTVGAIGVAAALALVARPLVRHARVLGQRVGATNRRFASFIDESLESFKLVRAHDAQDHWLGQMQRSASDVRDLAEAHARRQAAASFVTDVGVAAGVTAVLVLGVRAFDTRSGTLLVTVLAVARVLQRCSALQTSLVSIAHFLPALADIEDVTARAAASRRPNGEIASTRSGPSTVELRDVSFSYDGAELLALDRVSVVLPAGCVTAVVGPSGAGKTTFADVVLTLLHPSHGSMAVDGKVLEGASAGAWRQRTAYVPQDPALLPASVRENLTWLAPEADDTACRQALVQAGAEFVLDLPDGLDTVVGDRGGRLSGGERQRIALARALVRSPSLLVLDEATSALDAATEHTVATAIGDLHGTSTVLVIAHRLSTIRHADQVVVLDLGRVVEIGSWEELMGRPTGRLRSMVEDQATI